MWNAVLAISTDFAALTTVAAPLLHVVTRRSRPPCAPPAKVAANPAPIVAKVTAFAVFVSLAPGGIGRNEIRRDSGTGRSKLLRDTFSQPVLVGLLHRTSPNLALPCPAGQRLGTAGEGRKPAVGAAADPLSNKPVDRNSYLLDRAPEAPLFGHLKWSTSPVRYSAPASASRSRAARSSRNRVRRLTFNIPATSSALTSPLASS